MPKVHDRGGWPTDEPIDKGEHPVTDWEFQAHALLLALTDKKVIVTDELRRGIESIPPAEYEAMSYYDRWSVSIESLLVEKKVVTPQEIDEKVKHCTVSA